MFLHLRTLQWPLTFCCCPSFTTAAVIEFNNRRKKFVDTISKEKEWGSYMYMLFCILPLSNLLLTSLFLLGRLSTINKFLIVRQTIFALKNSLWLIGFKAELTGVWFYFSQKKRYNIRRVFYDIYLSLYFPCIKFKYY